MATVQLIFKGDVIRDIPLNKETITIGRKKENDIQIDNLAVSSHHAKIITILNDSFIEDTNSTNGTYVNGALIKKQALKNGDVIHIGKHDLKYVTQVVSTSNSFEKTMIINPSAEGMPEDEGSSEIDQSVGEIVREITSADTGAKNAIGEAKIRLLTGANNGKELPLTKVLTTLGKPGVQVAAITRRPTGYFLIHIDGGINHGRPKVNDKEIGSQAQQLHSDDVIEVAGVKMSFSME